MINRGNAALALLLVAVTATKAVGDETGRPGFHFLNLGTSARLEALGGAGATLAEGADALDWNPARIVRSRGLSATASWFNWLDDTQGGHAAFTMPLGRGALGVGARSLAIGEFDNTDLEDPVDQSDVALAVGGALGMRGGLSLGAAGKLIRSRLAGEDATGWALDAGADWVWVPGWDVVASLRNFGPAMGYGDGLEDQLPTQFRSGVSGQVRRLRFGLEGIWENGPGWGGTVGAEYRFLKRMGLRAGTRLDGSGDRAVAPWSAGAGIAVRPGLDVDYAFRDGDLAASHRIGLRWASVVPVGAAEATARSPREFYLNVVDRALDEALTDAPGSAGDSVIVRASKAHEAAELVTARLADRLKERGLVVEVRPPFAVIPDSLRRGNEQAIAASGLGDAVDRPVFEVEIRSSSYRIVRQWRDRWIGPKTLHREAEVDLAFARREGDGKSPTWTSAGSASASETVRADLIPPSAGYPPTGDSLGSGKPNPFVEPAIVTGIVAGLAVLFFSNRDVGD